MALQEQQFCSCKAFLFLKNSGFILKNGIFEVGIKMMFKTGQGCLLMIK